MFLLISSCHKILTTSVFFLIRSQKANSYPFVGPAFNIRKMIYPNQKDAIQNPLTISDEILSLLKASTVSLTATDLSMKLRLLSLRLSEHEILRELRSLQKEGLVRIEGGSWKPTSAFAKKPYIFN